MRRYGNRMVPYAYTDGRYAPLAKAWVAVEDRGFQLGDAVYEVIALVDGHPFAADRHLWRLRRALAALFIEGVPGDTAFAAIFRRLSRLSRIRNGILHVQVSRGAAARGHRFPDKNTSPTIAITIRPFDFHTRETAQRDGVSAIVRPDIRWGRADLKTTMLLPAVLAKEDAHRAGAHEAILVRDGMVTEGASSNIWMVDRDGVICTPPLSVHVLPGVTRDILLELLEGAGLAFRESPMPESGLSDAAELFLTSTTSPVLPIVRVDSRVVGKGIPGPVTKQAMALFQQEMRRAVLSL